MQIKKYFCSSPWFHIKIGADGRYEYCRWADGERDPNDPEHRLQDTSIAEYFQKKISYVRKKFLNGETMSACGSCHAMEDQGKISGRQKQLLKTGIQSIEFEKTFQSSPFVPEFIKSSNNNGNVDLLPQDWQIDLGNYCNSACVFCHPKYSSKLAAEFKKIGMLSEVPGKNWSDDPVLLDNFIEVLKKTNKISYLHFLGGETLITPAFKIILKKLIEIGINKKISIGFTTNLTVWDQEIIELLKQYRLVNIGMSIECLHEINDYLRWPSNITDIRRNLDSWVELGKKYKWLMQLRPTPTVFSIMHLKSLYEYAFENNIGIESCNFLINPKFMKISLVPKDLRLNIINQLKEWMDLHSDLLQDEKIINTRNPINVKKYILQDAQSYVNYLSNIAEEPHLWQDLVNYLKKLEATRKNKILDYAPEYEKLLRAAGY